VIAALAVWHFYWQVKRDVREPLLYMGMLALLFAYRLVRWRARSPPRGAHATAAPAAVTSRSGSATAPERT
jgi:sulfoxide reductase heme-binding subunit YedZ